MKNELIHESSPYLLQHAQNPVHWQPWGEKALQLAKEMDKPILVSIGYAACHWCHVMERESFENEDTAALMNAFFINIKIDREERPDLDHIYIDAVQAIAGNGGWPLNVFLTPEGKPFYGGTYFPPVQAYNRPSWQNVLHNIHDAWLTKRDKMEEQAETLTEHLKKSNHFGQINNNISIPIGENAFSKEDCINIVNNLMATADKEKGGFGNAPKFPQTFSINILLQGALFLGDNGALNHAECCLKKMLEGGIYDQLAGGLCRYSTDAEWLAPHFEKMLYDNALFLVTLANAHLLTKKDIYKKGIQHTMEFIFAEMKNKNGGYYAAIDADSEGVEGKFYVWDKAEIDTVLEKDAPLFNDYFNVTEKGNWEQKNILRILKPLAEIAELHKLGHEKAETIINQAIKKLLLVRNKRIRPTTDDKILLGWNALLITAFCKTYAALQNEEYKIAAIELFSFIESSFNETSNNYYHTYKNGEAKYPAFLDDYAYYIQACIHLQEITGQEHYLHKAASLTLHVLKNFADNESEYLFFTAMHQKDVVMRKIELYDGAIPSANAVMAQNIHYLSVVFNNSAWQQKSLAMIFSLKKIITKHPGSFGIWAAQAMNIAVGFNEIVIIGTNMIPQLQQVLLHFLPNNILQCSNKISDMPLLAKKEVFPKTYLYLCRNYMCIKPLGNADELIQALGKRYFNYSDHNI